MWMMCWAAATDLLRSPGKIAAPLGCSFPARHVGSLQGQDLWGRFSLWGTTAPWLFPWAGQAAWDPSAGWGFEAVSSYSYKWWKLPWRLALLQDLVSSRSPDTRKPLTRGDVAKSGGLGPHVQQTFFWLHFENYLEQRQALTSSTDLDHQHTEPTAPQNNKDVCSSLERIFTNQTSIFLILNIWYDITRETFCIHRSQMRLTSIYGYIFPERLSRKQSENIC